MASEDDDAPEDAFALVGNEIRAGILRTLGDARVEAGARPVLSFSELRKRTEVDVASSQFNYHLQQLVGRFVERTEEGYRMRPGGRRIYQTLRAGAFEPRDSDAVVDAGMDCHYCSGSVVAAFESGVVRIRCPDCEFLYDVGGTPPAVEDAAEALESVAARIHHQHLAFARGVCDTCGNEVGTRFVDPGGLPFSGAERHDVYVLRQCDNCGDQRYLSVGEVLLSDPELVAFCHRRGLDVLSTPLWEMEFAATDRSVTVRDRDPWAVALEVSMDGDTLELVVDDDLDVVERTRR
jgi:hypothetical protein